MAHCVKKCTGTVIDRVDFIKNSRNVKFIEIAQSNYAPQKASQKLGVGCKWFSVRCEPVYEIDPPDQYKARKK